MLLKHPSSNLKNKNWNISSQPFLFPKTLSKTAPKVIFLPQPVSLIHLCRHTHRDAAHTQESMYMGAQYLT